MLSYLCKETCTSRQEYTASLCQLNMLHEHTLVVILHFFSLQRLQGIISEISEGIFGFFHDKGLLKEGIWSPGIFIIC